MQELNRPRRDVHLFALLLMAVCSCASLRGPQALPPRPNVLLILADDLGYADCGFTGSLDVLTPNIDTLAAAGVVFTDAHVSASVCAPSRAGLLTGRYQQEFGFECNLAGDGGLLTPERTLARALQTSGYETIAIGKWHLGSAPEQHPLRQGFDHFTGLLGGSRSYFPITNKTPAAAHRIERDGVPVPESDFAYFTDFLSQEAVARIQAREGHEPFFMYLSYTAPHSPNQARSDLLARYEDTIPQKGRRTYAAMVTAMDEGIGRVIDSLRERGELDNTMVIFLSDNGGSTTNHSDNGPWRGMKGSKWEGGHRVPFLIHWPAALQPGTIDGLTSSLDLMPTALAVAGAAKVPANANLDGVNLVPHLLGTATSPPHDRLFWRRAVAAAVRIGDWKAIRITEADGTFAAPILVNLAEHPDEFVNQASDQPQRTQSMLDQLATWEKTLTAPRWLTAQIWRDFQRAKHLPNVRTREDERNLP